MTYLSTGGIRNLTCVEAAHSFVKNGISKIELSGGIYSPNLISEIAKLAETGIELTLHNYIPFTKEPFVINLASNNNLVYEKTYSHIKKCIDISSNIGSRWYGFHAGFLFDPIPKQLGLPIPKCNINNRAKAMSLFKERVEDVLEYAQKKSVNILIENNVLSEANYTNFGINPLLLTSIDEIEEFFPKFENRLSLLLDVAHLKVSSNTLGFELGSKVNSLSKFIGGLHISDNNGKSDENMPIDASSWFFQHNINLHSTYKVLEVYDYNFDSLTRQLKLCDDFL